MHPHSDYFPKDCKSAVTLYPLCLARCTSCGLYQNDYHLTTPEMFNDDYLYDNSVNTSVRLHWKNIAADLKKRIISIDHSSDGLSALDVGSNSGELLFYLASEGFAADGIEPSAVPHQIAVSRGLKSKNMLFNRETLHSLDRDKYSAITFTNTFPHIPQPVSNLTLAAEVIDRNIGVICIESPHAQKMLNEGQYDQIYHQHMTYLDIYPIFMLCQQIGLRLFDFSFSSIHNGSCRYYICHNDSLHQTSKRLVDYLDAFKFDDYISDQLENSFNHKSLQHRSDLRRYIQLSQASGHSLSIVSAPAKGNTTLNYCGITSRDIQFASEANKFKVGRFTPLSSIPIITDSDLVHHDPNILIIMAWNFYDHIASIIKPLFPRATLINPFDLPSRHD